MSRSGKPKPDYHHGNLRASLIEAARKLAEEIGTDGLTLREVARQAGVSHAAPYHHFEDKAAILRAIALAAFEDLRKSLERAGTKSKDPFKKLKQQGEAYIQFALNHKTEFGFMFNRNLCQSRNPLDMKTLDDAANSAFHELVGAITECQNAKQVSGTNPIPYAMLAWSTVHGLASILIDGPPIPKNQIAGLTKTVLDKLENGLRIRK